MTLANPKRLRYSFDVTDGCHNVFRKRRAQKRRDMQSRKPTPLRLSVFASVRLEICGYFRYVQSHDSVPPLHS